MTIGIASAAYVSAAVLFILSLGGLSGQESAKRAVWYGMAGMALAVIATVFGPQVLGSEVLGSGGGKSASTWLIVLVTIAGGALLGTIVARRGADD